MHPNGNRIREDYKRNGYVLLPQVLDAADLSLVGRDIFDVFARSARLIGHDAPEDSGHDSFSQLLLSLFASNRDAYLAAAKQTQYLASVHSLGLSRQILNLLDDVGIEVPSQSTRPVIHFMADGLRVEGGYHKTPAHQDWRSIQGSLDGVTLWLPLFDVGLNDYPLEVVAQSHRQGLLPSVDDAFGHRIADGRVSDEDFEPLPMAAGDVAAFSGFLVHRTGATGGRRVRIALSYRYNNAAERSYVERNYPMAHTYRPELRLLKESFPTAEDLAPIFGNVTQP